MSEIRSSWHLESRLAIPPGRYIPPKLAKEMGATQHVSVYWPSWKEPLPKSPHRHDPEIRKRLIAAQELLDAPRTFVASEGTARTTQSRPVIRRHKEGKPEQPSRAEAVLQKRAMTHVSPNCAILDTPRKSYAKPTLG